MACMQLHPDRGAFPGLAALLLARNKYTVAGIDDPGAAGRAAAGECRERAEALRNRATALMTSGNSGDCQSPSCMICSRTRQCQARLPGTGTACADKNPTFCHLSRCFQARTSSTTKGAQLCIHFLAKACDQ